MEQIQLTKDEMMFIRDLVGSISFEKVEEILSYGMVPFERLRRYRYADMAGEPINYMVYRKFDNIIGDDK